MCWWITHSQRKIDCQVRMNPLLFAGSDGHILFDPSAPTIEWPTNRVITTNMNRRRKKWHYKVQTGQDYISHMGIASIPNNQNHETFARPRSPIVKAHYKEVSSRKRGWKVVGKECVSKMYFQESALIALDEQLQTIFVTALGTLPLIPTLS